MMHSFFAGAITIACVVITLYFWRFMRETRDRFFGFFAVAFVLLAVEHIVWEFLPRHAVSWFYLIRLAAFLVILFAIADKNRADEGSSK